MEASLRSLNAGSLVVRNVTPCDTLASAFAGHSTAFCSSIRPGNLQTDQLLRCLGLPHVWTVPVEPTSAEATLRFSTDVAINDDDDDVDGSGGGAGEYEASSTTTTELEAKKSALLDLLYWDRLTPDTRDAPVVVFADSAIEYDDIATTTKTSSSADAPRISMTQSSSSSSSSPSDSHEETSHSEFNYSKDPNEISLDDF